MHRNVPAVLRDINKIVSDMNANVLGQVLATDPGVGNLVMDVDKEIANDVRGAIKALPTSIRTTGQRGLVRIPRVRDHSLYLRRA